MANNVIQYPPTYEIMPYVDMEKNDWGDCEAKGVVSLGSASRMLY